MIGRVPVCRRSVRSTSSERISQRLAGQSTGTSGCDVRRRAGQAAASDGGVHGDDPVEAELDGELGDLGELLVGQLGGDLDQERNMPPGRRVGLFANRDQQRPQPVTVWRSRRPGVFGELTLTTR